MAAPAPARRPSVDVEPPRPEQPARAASRPLGDTWRTWVDTAVRHRLHALRLLPYAGGPLIALTVVVDVLLGLLPVVFVLATSVVVGSVPGAVRAGVGSADWDRLVLVFLAATAAFVGQQALAPVQGALIVRMKRTVDERYLDDVLTATLGTTSIAPMEQPGTLDDVDDALQAFDRDVTTPGEACAGSLALLARYLRLAGYGVVVAVALAPWAGAALVLATMLFRYGQRGGLRKYSQVWRDVLAVRRRSSYLRQTATGEPAAKEARVYGLSTWLADRYAEAYTTMYGAVARRRRQVYLRPFLLITAVGLGVAALVLVAAARAGAAGAVTLTELALVLQCVMAALLLGEYYPESDVATQYGSITAAAKVRLEERVAAVAGAVERRDGPTVAVPPGAPSEALVLDAVTFAYPGSDRPVLDGLDLVLPAGRSTAVVGVNGAGKTTLVKLLTRLHEPTGGRILADGVDVAATDPAAWRRQVGVIFQDFVRYELSAADNIALGAAHVPRDDAAVRRAAERAGILDALEALPRGLETPLARAYDDGADLSGGQWQRVAIARALYALEAGARVLVLDEPTSALDVRAEAAFFDRFVELTRGVTSVLISHRFSSVRRADHVVVVDGGRVVEQGSHDELMAADGTYARLFRLQAERFAAGLDAEGNRVEGADPGTDGPATREATR